MSISKDQIKHIASLAKLELTSEELTRFEKEFNDILDYVSMVNQCDVEGIKEEHNLRNFKRDIQREDKHVQSPITTKELLQNATNNRTKNGYIQVRKKS